MEISLALKKKTHSNTQSNNHVSRRRAILSYEDASFSEST